jgi:hypothetical protein
MLNGHRSLFMFIQEGRQGLYTARPICARSTPAVQKLSTKRFTPRNEPTASDVCTAPGRFSLPVPTVSLGRAGKEQIAVPSTTTREPGNVVSTPFITILEPGAAKSGSRRKVWPARVARPWANVVVEGPEMRVAVGESRFSMRVMFPGRSRVSCLVVGRGGCGSDVGGGGLGMWVLGWLGVVGVLGVLDGGLAGCWPVLCVSNCSDCSRA